MNKFELKTEAEIAVMVEGGKKLAKVKKALLDKIKEGVTAWDLEVLARKMIAEEGCKPSFQQVSGYSWATCVNVNSGLVHGIPTEKIVFKKGDVVSIDLGVYYQGFHTDTSDTLGLKTDESVNKFLTVGREALKKAIAQCRPGNWIYDLSEAIEQTVKAGGYTPIKALVGHGIGKSLHEDPQIPCFVPGRKEESLRIVPGMVLAIEVMYAQGKDKVKREADGWTISMADDKMAALFEETVAVTAKGPKVLTAF